MLLQCKSPILTIWLGKPLKRQYVVLDDPKYKKFNFQKLPKLSNFALNQPKKTSKNKTMIILNWFLLTIYTYPLVIKMYATFTAKSNTHIPLN